MLELQHKIDGPKTDAKQLRKPKSHDEGLNQSGNQMNIKGSKGF
jgi:hypothetical protein